MYLLPREQEKLLTVVAADLARHRKEFHKPDLDGPQSTGRLSKMAYSCKLN